MATLRHAWIREGDEWPQVPDPDRGPTITMPRTDFVHVAQRFEEVGLDVYWLEP